MIINYKFNQHSIMQDFQARIIVIAMDSKFAKQLVCLVVSQ